VEDDSQLLWLSAYIHQNPAVAGLVDDLKDYPYNSYIDYAGLREGKLSDQSFILGMLKDNRGLYKKFVIESFDKIKKRKDLEYILLD
jgi:putative transposase